MFAVETVTKRDEQSIDADMNSKVTTSVAQSAQESTSSVTQMTPSVNKELKYTEDTFQ
jgi:hypothetical protein